MQVELAEEEYRLLLRLIESRVADYFMQIRHAILSTFKTELRQRKARLLTLREKLVHVAGNRIELSSEEVEELRRLLQEALHELPGEIWHTDSPEWRALLKDEKISIQHLLQRLAGTSEPSPA